MPCTGGGALRQLYVCMPGALDAAPRRLYACLLPWVPRGDAERVEVACPDSMNKLCCCRQAAAMLMDAARGGCIEHDLLWGYGHMTWRQQAKQWAWSCQNVQWVSFAAVCLPAAAPAAAMQPRALRRFIHLHGRHCSGPSCAVTHACRDAAECMPGYQGPMCKTGCTAGYTASAVGSNCAACAEGWTDNNCSKCWDVGRYTLPRTGRVWDKVKQVWWVFTSWSLSQICLQPFGLSSRHRGHLPF